MKVLHVVGSMDPNSGGVSQAVRTMIKGLCTQAIASEVLCLQRYKPKGQDNFAVHFAGPTLSAWHFSPGFETWLKINMSGFDIVVVHGLWQYHTYAVVRVLNRLSENATKVFIMPHGMLDPWFQKAKGRKIKAVRNWLLWQLAERFMIKNADGVLFTSETEKILAQKTFKGYEPKSESVVGLGVEHPPQYCPQMKIEFEQQCPREKTDGYLLFLGRIDPKKGLSILVEAYVALQKEGRSLPELVICGPGIQSDYGQALQKSAGKSSGIYFNDMVSGEAKWGAFYGCEAFILPSHQENFGIAVAEALACGKPVLISDQVNIYQQIVKNQAGLVESDSVAGVKELLKRWTNLSYTQKAKMNSSASQTFLRQFSIIKTTQELSAAFGYTGKSWQSAELPVPNP